MDATKKCHMQRSTAEFVMEKIEETIIGNLEIKKISTNKCKAFCIADLGCSVGPNTFYYVENILEALKRKFVSEGFENEEIPQFQVFFNDLPFNNFNLLFKFLPSDRKYFAAGVAGSFHGQLFPNSFLHFVYCSYALHWLSKVPQEVEDKDSPRWNKGRIHYTSASDLVIDAFKGQFAKDMSVFLNARANELVEGGLMLLVMPSMPDGIPHSNVPAGILLNHLGSCLMDMAKDGLTSEHLVDAFNIPMYSVTPKEMTELIQQNGCFSIERMEPTDCIYDSEKRCAYSIMSKFTAGLKGFITTHFGAEIFTELIDRFLENMDEVVHELTSCCSKGTQLTVIVKRRFNS